VISGFRREVDDNCALLGCYRYFGTIAWQFYPTPGSKWTQLHKVYQNRCTAKNSWWWAEGLPETCRI